VSGNGRYPYTQGIPQQQPRTAGGYLADPVTANERSVVLYQRGFHLMKLWNGFDAAC
jgi:hypothetical protein